MGTLVNEHLSDYAVDLNGFLFPHGHIGVLFSSKKFGFAEKPFSSLLRNHGDYESGFRSKLITVTLSHGGEPFTNHLIGLLDGNFNESSDSLLVFDSRGEPRALRLPLIVKTDDDIQVSFPKDSPTTLEVRRKIGSGPVTGRIVDVMQLTVTKKRPD